MHLRTLLVSLVSLTSDASLASQKVLQNTPSECTISDTNARNVFNAIHAAMRQWGSSIQHNGMSFFPAYIPERTLLYHGSRSPEKVTGMEWLAFEIDHAEMFALGTKCSSGGCRGVDDNYDEDRDENDPLLRPPLSPGYLHVYQTNRVLDGLLYIDGMSAAKSTLGTLDTQDLLLLNAVLDPLAEHERANLLCELGRSWGVEGFVRMEAGFEVILCNFSNGLDLVSTNKRPLSDTAEGLDDRFLFEYIRSVSERFWDIGASRVVLDYSSMVSAFLHPVNLSNPDRSSQLPRLTSSHPEQLSPIKTELQDVIRRPRSWNTANWQGAVDMIVSRYHDRLQFLVSNPSKSSFLATVNHLLNQFIDYSNITQQMGPIVAQCSSLYLRSVLISTPQDQLIHNAIYMVSERICETLCNARGLLLDECLGTTEHLQRAMQMVQELITWLDWSTWKRCHPCAYDEVCFVASWPFGEPEDHFRPSCLNNTEMRKRHGWGPYWQYNGTGLPKKGRTTLVA